MRGHLRMRPTVEYCAVRRRTVTMGVSHEPDRDFRGLASVDGRMGTACAYPFLVGGDAEMSGLDVLEERPPLRVGSRGPAGTVRWMAAHVMLPGAVGDDRGMCAGHRLTRLFLVGSDLAEMHRRAGDGQALLVHHQDRDSAARVGLVAAFLGGVSSNGGRWGSWAVVRPAGAPVDVL